MQIVELNNVLTPEQLAQARQALDRATWNDGRESARGRPQAVKHNEEMNRSCAEYAKVSELVRFSLNRHREFFPRTLVARQSPYLINRHQPGMAFGGHYDTVIRHDTQGLAMRSDWSLTVFLSSPDEYDGGELNIAGATKIKLPAGSALLYPSDSFHEVLPVTRGVRFATVGWLQSLVANRLERELLIELERTASAILGAQPQLPEADRLTGCVNRLMGLWARP